MSHYIVCHQKRNNPRVDIRICEKKCPKKDTCQEYLSNYRVLLQNAANPTSSTSQPVGMRAA